MSANVSQNIEFDLRFIDTILPNACKISDSSDSHRSHVVFTCIAILV